MNNQFDAKKIPPFIYLLLGTIIALVVFSFFVGRPLLTEAGNMQKAHKDVLKEIRDYDNAIKAQESIEAEIKKNQAEFEQKEKELFVDLDTSSRDIEKYCRENNIELTNYTLAAPQADPKSRVSTGGYPVNTVAIGVNYQDSYAKTISFLKYLEEGSKGCYYVKSCSLTQGEKLANTDVFDTKMSIELYYYDKTEAIVATEPPTQEATEKK
ncbi:MAG: hypothetical protein UD936_06370 [Acutalibacteraceae bacterium]|nr:hypothetical protein [Acutalibacteraceae bacterium]